MSDQAVSLTFLSATDTSVAGCTRVGGSLETERLQHRVPFRRQPKDR